MNDDSQRPTPDQILALEEAILAVEALLGDDADMNIETYHDYLGGPRVWKVFLLRREVYTGYGDTLPEAILDALKHWKAAQS